MTNKTKKKYPVFARTIIIYVIVMAIAATLLYVQFLKYEDGILDVCATQQDAYVQLVLDQINLKPNRNDAEIIQDILGTLDASHNRYWAFTRGESMLFVKDVLETNKYKNLSVESYFELGEAKQFIDELPLNRVVHQDIKIDGNRYIASGVSFAYGGTDYKLCLLTNRTVLLDNNRFLGAKAEIAVISIVIASLAFISAGILSHRIRSLQIKLDQQKDTAVELNRNVEDLNKRINNSKVYRPENKSWSISTLPVFLEKLPQKNVWPLTALLINCSDKGKQQDLIKELGSIANEILSFVVDDRHLLVLVMKQEKTAAIDLGRRFLRNDAFVEKSYYVNDITEYSPEKVLSMINAEELNDPTA